ncbi:MAG TPA: hypothetical protein VNK03_00755 [Gammaproteobacteria bacterium]|nr:hypothetical protein [Gammaproteobacteria bacterium]
MHHTRALDFSYEVGEKVVKFQYHFAMPNSARLNDPITLEKLKNE